MENIINFIYTIDGFLTEAVQNIRPGDGIFGKLCDLLFFGFTCFAEELVIIALIVFIYWCYNKKMGEAMLLSLYMSNAVNGIFKDLIRRPRPFLNPDYSQHLNASIGEGLVDKADLGESFSFPSGHSQNAGNFWPSMYLSHKKVANKKSKLLKIASIIIIPLVMISRVYLGVHYFSDTVIGASLGVICAFLMIKLYFKFYNKKTPFIICLYLISLIALFFNPTSSTLKTMGMGLGGIAGFLLESKFVNFSVETTRKNKIIRLVIGVSTVLLIRSLFKLVLPSLEEGSLFYTTNITLYNWGGFIRYMIMGLYGTFIFPLIFKKLNF